MNVMHRVFPVAHCTVTRWSMLFTSPVSVFTVVAVLLKCGMPAHVMGRTWIALQSSLLTLGNIFEALSKDKYRALWFLRSGNRGRNRGIGWLKWNRGMGKLHGGKQIWVAQQVAAPHSPQTELPCQNNVSMAKRLPTTLSASVKKTGKLDINPSVQSKAAPERLLCVRWTVVLQRSRPEKS